MKLGIGFLHVDRCMWNSQRDIRPSRADHAMCLIKCGVSLHAVQADLMESFGMLLEYQVIGFSPSGA